MFRLAQITNDVARQCQGKPRGVRKSSVANRNPERSIVVTKAPAFNTRQRKWKTRTQLPRVNATPQIFLTEAAAWKDCRTY